MRQVALDEQRHIGFGVKLLYDLRAEPGVVDAVADLIRRVTPSSLAVFIPPNWDRSYTECFGFTLEEIYTEGARSFEQKLRSAGMPLESLPGPSVFPPEMTPSERADYGIAMLQAGFIGPPNGEPPRDPASLELLMTSVARAIDTRARAERVHGPVGVRRRRALARARRQRLDPRGRGPRVARGPGGPLPLRGLGRGRRRPPGPAPRAWPRASCARTAPRARSGPPVRSSDEPRRSSSTQAAERGRRRPRAPTRRGRRDDVGRLASASRPARSWSPAGERTAEGCLRSASRRAGRLHVRVRALPGPAAGRGRRAPSSDNATPSSRVCANCPASPPCAG